MIARKRLLSLAAYAALFLLFACSKDDDPAKPAAVLNKTITNQITAGANLSVYTAPVITFNNELGQSTNVEGIAYRPVLDEIHVYKDATELTGTMLMADNKTAKFIPLQPLPPESSIRVTVKTHWEQNLNGTWTSVTDQGTNAVQSAEGTFSTGKYADPAEIVTAILPQNNAAQQSIFTYPLIVFKTGFETPVTSADNGKKYRPVIDEVTLLRGTEKVNAPNVWNDAHDSLYLKPADVLQGQTTYTTQVKYHWVTQDGENWVSLTIANQVQTTILTSIFITGTQGDLTHLLPDNITASYPVPFQYFFLQNEYANGYIILETPLQNNLVQAAIGEKVEIRFTTPGQTEIKTTAQFDATTRTLSYEMPVLKNETIYGLRAVKISVGGSEQEVYKTSFRTSAFNTFLEKLSAVTNAKGYSWSNYQGTDEIKTRFNNMSEYFDQAEIRSDSLSYPGYKGLYYLSGLIKAEALPGNKFFDDTNTFLYKDLPGSSLNLTWRSAASVGIPPKYSIYFSQGNVNPIVSLSQTEINQNSVTFPGSIITVLCYNLSVVIDRDLYDLKTQAANSADRETNPYIKRLVYDYMSTVPSFSNYKVKLSYKLPGTGIITSEKEITIDYNY